MTVTPGLKYPGPVLILCKFMLICMVCFYKTGIPDLKNIILLKIKILCKEFQDADLSGQHLPERQGCLYCRG
jgi:hypothetical protein